MPYCNHRYPSGRICGLDVSRFNVCRLHKQSASNVTKKDTKEERETYKKFVDEYTKIYRKRLDFCKEYEKAGGNLEKLAGILFEENVTDEKEKEYQEMCKEEFDLIRSYQEELDEWLISNTATRLSSV